MLFRPLSIVTIALTVIFAVVILLMPQFAPETAVLSYTVPLPGRELGIWLMDVRSGLSYDTGASTNRSNYSVWSPDGNVISTVDYFSNEVQLESINLTTGVQQSVPIPALNNIPRWSPDMTKIAYSSARNDGSLRIIDVATGEETIVLEGIELSSISWLQDSASLVVTTRAISRSDPSESQPPRIHRLDLNSGELTTIVENYDGGFFNISESPQQIVYMLYAQMMITPIDTPEETRMLTSIGDKTVVSFSFVPPDQQQIMLILGNDGVQETWLVDIDTGERELINEWRTNNSYIPVVRWSDDGELMARISESTSTSSTIEIVRDRQNEREITINQPIMTVTWSPDNRYLLAFIGNERIEGYFVIDVSAGETQLANDILPLSDWTAWQPQSE